METIASRLEALAEQSRALRHTDPHKSIQLATIGSELAKRENNLTSHFQFEIERAQTSAGTLADIPSSFAIIESILPAIREFGDDEILATALELHAACWSHLQSDFTPVIEEHLVARSLAAKSGNQLLLAKISLNLGHCYGNTGQYIKALDAYEDVISQNELEDYSIRALFGSGDIYLLMLDKQRAHLFYTEALQRAKRLGRNDTLGQAMIKLGYVTLKQGDPHRALEIFTELIATRWNDFIYYGALLYAASAYLDLGDYSSARRNLELILADLTISVGDTARNATLFLAELALKEGRPQESIDRLLPIEPITAATNRGTSMEVYSLLSQAYEAIGDSRNALEYLKRNNKVRDELHQEELELRAQLAQRDLEKEQNRQEAERQRLRAERLEQELTTRMLQLSSQAEMLGTLRNDLMTLVRDSNVPHRTVTQVYDRLRTLPCQSVDWKKFDTQFKAAHPEFVQSLSIKHPVLTAGDVRLCSLVRMQMKSDEIARLFCISERSIETHRFRVRKKLGLKRGEDLTLYLAKI